MSAISELRARLDARGVDHLDYHDVTEWGNGAFYATDVVCGFRLKDDKLVIRRVMTPTQAVEATLGRGTCQDVSDSAKHADVAFACSECGCWVAYDEYWETGIYVRKDGQPMHIIPHFCPNCGREVVQG